MGVELLEIGLGVCNCNVAMYNASAFATVLKACGTEKVDK
jgi:hypothetical protein